MSLTCCGGASFIAGEAQPILSEKAGCCFCDPRAREPAWQIRYFLADQEHCGGMCRAMCGPSKATFCSLALRVAKRKLALPCLTPHPSSPLLQALGRTRDLIELSNCLCWSPSQKLERALQSVCIALLVA